MSETFEYLKAYLDIRIINRKKHLMEGLITPAPQFQIKKGAILGINATLNIPLFYQNALGKITHIIELQNSFYIKVRFDEKLDDSTFNLMNSGSINNLSICFTPHLERQKHDTRIIFSMRIRSFHIHEEPVQSEVHDFEIAKHMHVLHNLV